MKLFKKMLALLLVTATLVLAACNKVVEAETFHGVVFPVAVYTDVYVESGFLSTVDFPEDGSFEEKKDVFGLTVKNDSVKTIQFLRIKVTTDRKEMTFEITTLPGNMAVNVFEKSGQTLEKDEKILSIKGENRADFGKSISLQQDTFELVANDKVINVRNISDKDINSDIYLYYKKKDTDGNYFGGITFRARINGLRSGELKQVSVSNFALSDSEVIFLDYAGE